MANVLQKERGGGAGGQEDAAEFWGFVERRKARVFYKGGMLAIVHAEEDWHAGGWACKAIVQQGKIAAVNILAYFRELQRGCISEQNTVEIKVGAG